MPETTEPAPGQVWFPGAVQLRCSDHDRFVAWVNPPLPPDGVRVGCGPACEQVAPDAR